MTDVAAQEAQAIDNRSGTDLRDPWLRSYFTNRLAQLDNERLSYFPTWRDLAGQFAPRRGRFLQSANDTRRGNRRDQRIINNTPLRAARTMASGMMSGISSPARPWFRLRLANDRANEAPGARAWLDDVQARMLRVFAKSNLYNCLHSASARSSAPSAECNKRRGRSCAPRTQSEDRYLRSGGEVGTTSPPSRLLLDQDRPSLEPIRRSVEHPTCPWVLPPGSEHVPIPGRRRVVAFLCHFPFS